VFGRLLELCPTPQAAVAADVAAIRGIIAPLGLHNKRAVAVQRLSHDFVHKQVWCECGGVWVCW
jgi:methyl-CpG-binding domain protein 4